MWEMSLTEDNDDPLITNVGMFLARKWSGTIMVFQPTGMKIFIFF